MLIHMISSYAACRRNTGTSSKAHCPFTTSALQYKQPTVSAQPTGLQAHYRIDPGCFGRHGLGPANFTTGSYSKWGKCCAEFLTPRQVGQLGLV